MNEPFSEMIGRLGEVRQAVRDDLERYSKSSREEPDHLTRLLRAVRNFAAQTDNLLDMMIERDPLNAEIAQAEDLLEFFHGAEMQVVGLLESGRG